MPNKDRSFHESPQKAGGEGWLYSEQLQKLCHFKPDTATVHAQWVAIRTYSYVPLSGSLMPSGLEPYKTRKGKAGGVVVAIHLPTKASHTPPRQ